MAFRRHTTLPDTVETEEDARDLASAIREAAGRLRGVPGLLDGALEEMHGALERLLRDYERLSRGRVSSFEKDLEHIAKRAKELREAGRLSPRHLRLIDQALLHARRTHFWNARRSLEKLAKFLEPSRELAAAVETYRTFHRKAALRVREGEDRLAALRAIPTPPVGPDEVAEARRVVEACSRAADEAWTRQTHRPVARLLEDLVSHPDVEGLGLLSTMEFACLREIADLLEAKEDLKPAIGSTPLAELVEAAGYSAAKWERVYPEATTERHRLQELLHQVRPVVTGIHGAAFLMETPAESLRRRLAAWRAFPGAGAFAAWDDLERLLDGGRWSSIRESARAYERLGDAAERAWSGALAAEIRDAEKDLAEASEALDRLPDPDTLTV